MLVRLPRSNPTPLTLGVKTRPHGREWSSIREAGRKALEFQAYRSHKAVSISRLAHSELSNNRRYRNPAK